ncbi:MAG: hypothetical protein OQL19_22800 [Gammaproteobacteria bacterium]|nr:hypothetical protein [Gammaproteobacteria bacterium]
MNSTTPEEETTVTLEEALLQFNRSVLSQEEQNLQMGRRTSYIISFGVLAIILLAIGVVYLTWSQKNDMKKMNDYMEGMTKSISVMSDAVVGMQTTMRKVEGGVNELSYHAQSISHAINQKENVTGTLLNISDTIRLLQTDAQGFKKGMGDVNYNLGNINKQMKNLNRKLSVMVQDVNRMPSPTRMFPF